MSTDKAIAGIQSIEPAILDVFDEAARVSSLPMAKRQKYYKLLEVADKLGAMLDPLTPCKSGCSHCCHMAVGITELEAEKITNYVGIAAIKQAFTDDPREMLQRHEAMLKNYTAVPCTFFKEEKCSIYEVRPFACRIHHSLDETNVRCDLYQHPMLSTPSLNCEEMDKAYANIFLHDAWGDIRDYFPGAA